MKERASFLLDDNLPGLPLDDLFERTLQMIFPDGETYDGQRPWLASRALRAVCEALLFYGGDSFFRLDSTLPLWEQRLNIRVVKRHRNWKGGSVNCPHGYKTVYVGKGHHLARSHTGYAYEHRLVAEKMLGRRLQPGEIVHHINGNKADNRPENLEILSSIAEHRNKHRKPGSKVCDYGTPNPIVSCACGCGAQFPLYDKTNRPRTYLRAGCSRRGKGRPNPIISCGCGCGATFTRYDAKGRKRAYRAGHAKRHDGRQISLFGESGFGTKPG